MFALSSFLPCSKRKVKKSSLYFSSSLVITEILYYFSLCFVSLDSKVIQSLLQSPPSGAVECNRFFCEELMNSSHNVFGQ